MAHKAQADKYMKEAGRAREGWFKNYRDAADSYYSASSCFETISLWKEAGEAAQKSAECEILLKRKGCGAKMYLIAAGHYESAQNIEQGIICRELASNLFNDAEIFDKAAKHYKEAAVYWQNKGEKEKAATFFEKAATCHNLRKEEVLENECKAQVASLRAIAHPPIQSAPPKVVGTSSIEASDQATRPSSSQPLPTKPSSPKAPITNTSQPPLTNTEASSSKTPLTNTEASSPSKLLPCSSNLTRVAFYKIIDNYEGHTEMKLLLDEHCKNLRVSGTIDLGPNGICGKICGPEKVANSILKFIQGKGEVFNDLSPLNLTVYLEDEKLHKRCTGEWDYLNIEIKDEVDFYSMFQQESTKELGKLFLKQFGCKGRHLMQVVSLQQSESSMIEVMAADGKNFVIALPHIYKRNMGIRQGGYVLADQKPQESGGGELDYLVYQVLDDQLVAILQKCSDWPKCFKREKEERKQRSLIACCSCLPSAN